MFFLPACRKQQRGLWGPCTTNGKMRTLQIRCCEKLQVWVTHPPPPSPIPYAGAPVRTAAFNNKKQRAKTTPESPHHLRCMIEPQMSPTKHASSCSRLSPTRACRHSPPTYIDYALCAFPLRHILGILFAHLRPGGPSQCSKASQLAPLALGRVRRTAAEMTADTSFPSALQHGASERFKKLC